MMWKLISGFCVATVITQMLVLGFFGTQGTLNGDSVTKMIALVHGIDISGDRLQAILNEAQTTETPSFDELLQKRFEEGLDSDLRFQSLASFLEFIESQRRELEDQARRFDTRRDAFNLKLEEIENGIKDEGTQELKRTLEVLNPIQAKTQLLIMFDEGEIDRVVNIVQAMSTDKTKKIYAEFNTPEEEEKLSEILRRIGEGEPKKSLIEQARKDT